MRVVFRSLGVRLSPREQHQSVDLPFGKSISPLEEHMFNKVSYAGAPRRLIERADRIVQVTHDDRNMPARQYDGEHSVVQPPFAHWQVVDGGGRGAWFHPSSHFAPRCLQES